MSDPNDLRAFHHLAWQHLSRGVADAKSPARYPTLATVSHGRPQARTVALRHADPIKHLVECHTDSATAKIEELRARPYAEMHFWIKRADLQIRLQCDVTIMTGAEVEEAWRKVPEASRISYGTLPIPGQPIPHVYAYEKPPNRDRFAVLRGQIIEMDLVELGAQHRRAVFTAEDGWVGTWVAP